MIRACLDTNVLVSGLISPKGASHEVLSALRKRDFLLISSEAIQNELKKVLNYSKIKDSYNLNSDQIKRFLKLVDKYSHKSQGSLKIQAIENDPDDNKFLEAAIEGEADFIVTGDKHLLDLGEYERIPIVIPRYFLEIIKERLQ